MKLIALEAMAPTILKTAAREVTTMVMKTNIAYNVIV